MALVVTYAVATTGDRFFIPYNTDADMATQRTTTEALSPLGVEAVA